MFFLLALVDGVIVIQLALAALGARPTAPFVSLVYQLARPLVAPFRGAFGPEVLAGRTVSPGSVLALAVYTMVAMAVDRFVALVVRH